MPKVALELDLNVYVLAEMCNSFTPPNHCPVEYGFKCPFGDEVCCGDVSPGMWKAVCLAEEEKDGED